MLSSAAWAAAAHEDGVTFDRISFSVSATQEVENDTLVAVMYAHREGQDAAALADAVNKAITDALTRTRQVPAVKVQTLNYRQSPVYRNQIVSGWRVRQSIRLESRDAAVLSELIGELQSTLSIESVSYTVSEEARRAVEDGLIASAMAAFCSTSNTVTPARLIEPMVSKICSTILGAKPIDGSSSKSSDLSSR